MSASARAILTAKINSHPFDDRVFLLDVPAKIGRSHKDDKAESGNGYFDCKVLSRQHAMLIYEDGKFFLVDTASSNGSFVNNIRLSKSGEESKLTRIFSNDVLRFGSDVVDKARQVTQKCIVGKLRLLHPDGREEEARPSESRLFRPNDSTEDLSALTHTLQEALKREKSLEDRLLRVRAMISKNIGKTHTDLLRLFENMKQELMVAEDGANAAEASSSFDAAAFEKLILENASLSSRLVDLEQQLRAGESRQSEATRQAQTDAVEVSALKKACQLQRRDLENLETTIKNLQDEMYHNRIEAEEKLSEKVKLLEAEKKEAVETVEAELLKQEEAFAEERMRIKEQLHEVTSNEVSLLNRIKCLEAEESYSHAEVERMLKKEREVNEDHQEMQLIIEGLEAKLKRANKTIEEQSAQVVVRRSEEDIKRISELEATLSKANDLSYLKQELIEARARKSASDDELGTLKGKMETLQNTITTLTSEVDSLRKRLGVCQEKLDDRTKEAQHLAQLVDKMEATNSQDEMNRVQMADLKQELAGAEMALKDRNDEVVRLRNEVSSKSDEIKQREIDISCLRGQVESVLEDLDRLKAEADQQESTQREGALREERASFLGQELSVCKAENKQLAEDLRRQQTLYSELKKMRGRGEEMDLIQSCQEELEYSRKLCSEYERKFTEQTQQIDVLTGERVRLLQELTKKGNRDTTIRIRPNEAAVREIGHLKLYEVALGIVFLVLIFNWSLF